MSRSSVPRPAAESVVRRSRLTRPCTAGLGVLVTLLLGSRLLQPDSLLAAQQLASPAKPERVEAAANQASAAAAAKKEGEPNAPDSKPPVTVGEKLSFDQAKVAAEMSELEERMFRLAEALKELEPENSSRLRIALKNAREELILHDMKQTQELLVKLELNDALVEEKQLLAKLQRLHDLLLSVDLDFQMRLEQLRQIREILRRLDKAIQEEDREEKLSKEAADADKQAATLRERRASLEELIKKQTAHLEEGRKLAKVDQVEADERQALSTLGRDQAETRSATRSLAEAEAAGEEPKNLDNAQAAMGRATQSLEKEQAAAAVPEQELALESLKKELGRVTEELKRREDQIAAEKFIEMRKDQAGNRQTTDGIGDSVRKLGDSGASALSELIRAGGNMSSAEGELERRKPEPASAQQDRALQSLKYARAELARQEQELLEGLRGEVKRRVLEALTIMLEKQIGVRHATETLGPKVKSGSREALTAVVGLGKAEGRIVELMNESLTLVEETEFGIALPAALRVVRRSMLGVKGSLEVADASPAVVSAEKNIESDLKDLLDAMKQLPANRPPSDRSPGGQQDRERELNRLAAELKMLRLLQVRVNDETVSTDGKRPADATALPAALKKAIAAIGEHQDEIREATERLAEERGDEAP